MTVNGEVASDPTLTQDPLSTFSYILYVVMALFVPFTAPDQDRLWVLPGATCVGMAAVCAVGVVTVGLRIFYAVD